MDENEELLSDSIVSSNNNVPVFKSSTFPATLPTPVTDKREETRGVLALVFIAGFFTMLIFGGMLVAFTNDSTETKVQNLQDVFIVISGVLSGPLGFVIGYYFRRQEEKGN